MWHRQISIYYNTATTVMFGPAKMYLVKLISHFYLNPLVIARTKFKL